LLPPGARRPGRGGSRPQCRRLARVGDRLLPGLSVKGERFWSLKRLMAVPSHDFR